MLFHDYFHAMLNGSLILSDMWVLFSASWSHACTFPNRQVLQFSPCLCCSYMIDNYLMSDLRSIEPWAYCANSISFSLIFLIKTLVSSNSVIFHSIRRGIKQPSARRREIQNETLENSAGLGRRSSSYCETFPSNFR